MKLLRGCGPLEELKKGTVATIGNFDGVHRGHQALLQRLCQQAARLGLPTLVIIFEPQPAEFFQQQQAPARLSTLREKIAMFKQCGIDYVLCLKFNKQLARMEAEEFVNTCLLSLAHVKHLLIGQDFHFGRGRIGDIQLLKNLAAKRLCEVEVFANFYLEAERVSSTTIRHALEQKNLQQAAHWLGRPYSMCGRVGYGAGRGKQWGIPTANLRMFRNRLPLQGVFCVQVKRQNGQKVNGVANLGLRPTVDGSRYFLEVHLLHFSDNLYGELIQVVFLKELRKEQKFASVEELIAQIRRDIELAQYYFEKEESMSEHTLRT